VVTETDLLQYARAAEELCCAEFSSPNDRSRGTLLLYGLRPECVLENADRRYDIYLQNGSDALQLRLQIGHEVFHRICSQGRIFHWTHELLACLFSVRMLRRQGFDAYAAQTAREYQHEAQALPLAAFLTADLWSLSTYPDGYYGRAYTTGLRLEEAVGWRSLRSLARAPLGPNGEPDISVWLATLSLPARQQVDALLEQEALRIGAPLLLRTASKWA